MSAKVFGDAKQAELVDEEKREFRQVDVVDSWQAHVKWGDSSPLDQGSPMKLLLQLYSNLSREYCLISWNVFVQSKSVGNRTSRKCVTTCFARSIYTDQPK